MNLTITTDPIPMIISPDEVILVRGTRVPLDAIVFEFKQGATAEGIAEQFSSLDLADVYAVINYYLQHQQDVENYLEQCRQSPKRFVSRMNGGFHVKAYAIVCLLNGNCASRLPIHPELLFSSLISSGSTF